MTTYTIDPPSTPAELAAENARLRLAVAHLAVYARAVLECRDTGGLTITHQGFPAYQTSHALHALEDCTTRVLAGDWLPITPGQIADAWNRYRRGGLFMGYYLTHHDFTLAVSDLLWHPPATVHLDPTLPVGGTVGLAGQPT